MECDYCEYKWESRKEEPKACPRCKHRFDYPLKNKLIGERDGEED